MKPTFVISCPIDTVSGYGARSRDIVRALLKYDKYDLKILAQRWGSTPYGALDKNDPEDQKILSLIWTQPQLPAQPDVWAQITVPNEFQPIGKFNIGITAGIETDLCDPSWLEGCNRMNLNLVSSNHAKKVFELSSFEKKDKNTNQTTSLIKLEKPIEVLFEGADLEKYFPILDDDLEGTELVTELDEIKEDFCYLFVGHWLQGDLGEDRKNVGYLVKSFLETFKNKTAKPALILKTSSATCSIMDRDEVLMKIERVRRTVKGDLPNIYLLHGELEDEDINNLYNHPKVKAMVSLTKGEGFGRPLLEFTLVKKPLITTAYSGHLDFLKPEFVNLVGGRLTPVHPSAQVKNMILADAKWFTPDDGQVGFILDDVYKNYNKYLDNAKRQAHHAKTNFSFDKMAELLDSILEKNIIKQVAINLPTLNKIELPKLKKI